MRSMCDMDTCQIEILDACIHRCANCTRFCGHKKPYFMDFETFKTAVDSMVDYPKMTGIMGGEPLLHPEFEKFCNYLHEKIPKEQCGLWSCFPKGYEHYREAIAETFYHVFVNDHTRSDVMHHPPLVGIEEIEPDKNKMWQMIDHCWAQMSWSASINPKGAWFCEIAASMSILFEEGDEVAWKVEPGWWWKIPKDFKEQMESFCPHCGFSVPLKRRSSQETIDDISPKNVGRLMGKSFKIDKMEYVVHDLKMFNDTRAMASYKDFDYRNNIAHKFGMWLMINSQGFWTPYCYKEFKCES